MYSDKLKIGDLVSYWLSPKFIGLIVDEDPKMGKRTYNVIWADGTSGWYSTARINKIEINT